MTVIFVGPPAGAQMPAGYYPPPQQPSYMYGQPQTVVVQPQLVAVVGGCPACRVSCER